MRFSMVAEAGWDVGGVAGCLAAAGLVVLDVSPAAIMLFALPALGLGVVLVRLFEAEDESQEWPELHAAIREARKAYQADGIMPDSEDLGTLADGVRTTV